MHRDNVRRRIFGGIGEVGLVMRMVRAVVQTAPLTIYPTLTLLLEHAAKDEGDDESDKTCGKNNEHEQVVPCPVVGKE